MRRRLLWSLGAVVGALALGVVALALAHAPCQRPLGWEAACKFHGHFFNGGRVCQCPPGRSPM